MSTVHEPVLVKEVLDSLQPKKNQNFVDCTVGGGGHAAAILEKTGPEGMLLGMDWDSEAIKRCTSILAKYSHRTVLVTENYINTKKVVYEKQFHNVSGILIDLGLSMDQLQISGRGFSFQQSEPLDMRFSAKNELSAEVILNSWTEHEILTILRDYGEEKEAKKIARSIVKAREEEPIKTTLQLVNIIVQTKAPDRRKKIHPATQTFQALRIAVNNEMNNVKAALSDLIEILEPGGRLAVISFHSIEDRIVKEQFKLESKECLCPPEIPVCVCEHEPRVKIITKKPLSPSDEEIAKNFRSRSAKLRVVEKL